MAEPPAPPHPGVSPYPPLPGDEFDGGRGNQPGYGSASPYPAYTPYGPDDEIADDALTDYGLPSPQSYGYAPPPPQAEPLPDVGVPEPRFGPSAPSAPSAAPGSPAPQAPSAPQAPQAPPPPSASVASGYREDGPDDDDFRIEPFRVGEPRAGETGYRDEPALSVSSRPAGRFPAESDRPEDEDVPPDFGPDRDRPAGGDRRGLGSPGPHRAPSGDTGLRDAPPPTGPPQPGLPQPGLPQPGATPSGAGRPGLAPARNPAAAPPLGRPVAPPERSQPSYPPPGHLKEGPSAARSPA